MTTGVPSISTFWGVTSYSIRSGYSSPYLFLSMYTSSTSYTCVGTPVIPVVILVLLMAASALWSSLHTSYTTDFTSIICSVFTPGISNSGSMWVILSS